MTVRSESFRGMGRYFAKFIFWGSFVAIFNLRISGRLYAGFGILLLFIAALAGVGIRQLGAIGDSVAVMTLQSKNTVRVGEITTDLQAIRRGVERNSSARSPM
jgi:hypothetical protein